MKMTSEMFFGEWLKQRRKEVGLTQSQLSLRLNFSLIHLRKIESGERRPSEQLVRQLAKIFNISEVDQTRFLRFARGDIQASENDFADNDQHQIGKSSNVHIPASVASIVGRDQELSALHRHLLDENIRLITLIGPPGIGKTRLALELARHSVSDFPDGVFYVPLGHLENSSQISPAIFQTLGYIKSKNQFDIEQLTDGIGEKCILVVLDNLEHLIDDSAALVSHLLSECPRLKIVATSRESLRVPGEWLNGISPLAYPDGAQSIDIENISQFPALSLFVERARAIDAKFSLNRENVQAVASICAKLEGIPLAIELIASRIRVFSPGMLWQKLDEQFIMSAEGTRAVPARQKTLRNAIEWSYNLLSLEEQGLLTELCVFSGFTIPAVEKMLAGKRTTKPPAGIVFSLMDKSLIQRLPDVCDENRFGMLMMIRQFALERLLNSGREAEIRDWHLAYFLYFAELADKEIHGSDQSEWMGRIEQEYPNFQIALEWSVSAQKTESAIRLLGALGWTWWIRGRSSEMHEWFDRICALPGLANYPAPYARLLNRMGYQYWELAQGQKAQDLLEESRTLWESLGEAGETGLADCLNWLGVDIFDTGVSGTKKATALIERSLSLYQKHGDIVGSAQAMLNVAYVNRFTDNTLEWYEKSLKLFKQAGDIWGMSQAYQGVARECTVRGDYKKARWYIEQQLVMDENLNYFSGLMTGMRDLGNLALVEREYSKAKECFDQSLVMYQAHGLKPDRYLLFFMGILALCQNDYPSALQRFLSIYQVTKEPNDTNMANDLFMGLSAVAAGMNQHEHAAKLYGAFKGSVGATGFRHISFFEMEFDRHLRMAKDQLGEDTFECLANAGCSMEMEQAIEYALNVFDAFLGESGNEQT